MVYRPRSSATMPVRTISRIPNSRSRSVSASFLDSSPMTARVIEVEETSRMEARNTLAS